MTDTERPQTEPVDLSVLRQTPGLIESLTALAEAVPESTPEEAYARIAAQVLAAEDIEALNRPWQSEGLRAHLDRPLIVHAIKRMPSDYEGGLGWYLVLDCEDARHRRVVTTTGSVAICLQLAKAWQLGLFPVGIIASEAKRKTARGFTPLRAEVFTAKMPESERVPVAAG
jgi:hypothetical protein